MPTRAGVAARPGLAQHLDRTVGRGPMVAMVLAGLGGLIVIVALLTGGVQRWMALALVGAVAPLAGLLLHRERATSNRLNSLIDTSGALFWEVEMPSGRLTALVGPAEKVTGLGEAELLGRPLIEILHDSDLHEIEMVLGVLETRGEAVWECRMGSPAAGFRRFRHHIDRIAVRSGYVLRGVSFDVTALHRAQVALSRYADIVNQSRDALLVVRADGADSLTIVEANEACEALLGVSDFDLVNRSVADVVPWLGTTDLRQAAARAVESGMTVAVGNITTVGVASVGALDVDLAPLPDGSVAITARDVTERVLSEQTIRRQAEHDELTGLANRSLFMDRLTDLLTAEGSPLAVMLINLDNFKDVNDKFGLDFGDELLRRVAHRLRSAVRDGDMVARLGGDEFAVLLPGASSKEARLIGARVSAACAETVECNGSRVSVDASIGAVLAPEHGRDISTLLRRADLAMYEAKRSGSRVSLFDLAGEAVAANRVTMAADLERAFDEGEFRLWFQPKIDLVSGSVIGAEGLVRWDHPVRGSLLPGEFLDVLDAAGYLDRLTTQVLEQGAAMAARCVNIGFPMEVSINLAASSLTDPTLPNRVARLLERFQLEPSTLMLEIGESDITENLELAIPMLETLDQLGVSLSIDDFGTGHSSLASLRGLPVDEIKIDHCFIAAMTKSESDLIIVRSVIDLAHSLGLRTVAEGVENPESREALRGLGCELAQGYLFNAPMPAEVFLSHLRRRVPTG